MTGKDDSPPRAIDDAAKSTFLAALLRGARREDAAAEAGFSMMGFYGARQRDPAFKAAWTEALRQPAAADRRARAYAERGEIRIASANRRLYQRRRRRHVRFDAEAQAVFLTHFAQTCDTVASAEAAGVCESTVHRHRRINGPFAEAYAQALAEGYARLETEALRQRLAAQAMLRAAVEAANDPPRNGEGDRSAKPNGGGVPAPSTACPTCGQTPDPAAEFDRIMKLLARHDRAPRRVESRFKPGGRRQRWTFDQAIELLDKKLRALGLRTSPPP